MIPLDETTNQDAFSLHPDHLHGIITRMKEGRCSSKSWRRNTIQLASWNYSTTSLRSIPCKMMKCPGRCGINGLPQGVWPRSTQADVLCSKRNRKHPEMDRVFLHEEEAGGCSGWRVITHQSSPEWDVSKNQNEPPLLLIAHVARPPVVRYFIQQSDFFWKLSRRQGN